MKLHSMMALAALLATTVHCQIPSAPTSVLQEAQVIGTFIYNNIFNIYFYNGVVLGLQQDPTITTTTCFNSYQLMVQQQVAINAFWALPIDPSMQSTVAGGLATSIWQLPSTYIVTTKRYIEMTILFYQLYNACYLDDMVIQVGLSVNSFSGFANFIIGVAVWVLNNASTTATTSDAYNMYTQAYNQQQAGNAAAQNAAVQQFAVSMMNIIKKLFNIQAPTNTHQASV